MAGPTPPDSIQVAFETGRLDLVSVLLACVAILFALSTIPIFAYLRYRAHAVAKLAAESVLRDAIQKIEQDAITRMEAMLPSLVSDYMELAKQNAVTGDEANEIAAVQDDE